MSKPKSPKPNEIPGRNTRVRQIMQGAWEDANGCAHIDVPGVHQWMRDHGFSVVDTKEEIEDTARRRQQILSEQHGFAADKIIIRRSRKE